MKVLLEKGADVNAVNKGGVTALHRAAMWGNTEAASLLIAAGANARLRTKPSPYAPQGETPEQAAERYGHHDLAALLRLAGEPDVAVLHSTTHIRVEHAKKEEEEALNRKVHMP